MFRHIKLKTISVLFAILLSVLCGSLAVTHLYLSRSLGQINATWQLYQTDRSEKARLESTLSATIGFGGMVHNFKNYILRQEVPYLHLLHNNIGAARSLLHQLRFSGISPLEATALDELANMLEQYNHQSHQARKLIEAGRPFREFVAYGLMDDTGALQALKTLRQMAHGTEAAATGHFSKVSMVADIRAAMGFGGFIHYFKDYVLRQDEDSFDLAIITIRAAEEMVSNYRKLANSPTEHRALTTIGETLLEYDRNLNLARELVKNHTPIRELDNRIRVDDQPALNALHTLDNEIALQLADNAAAVTTTLDKLTHRLSAGTLAMIAVLLLLAIATYWLMVSRVITPVRCLTKNLVRLADNDIDIEIKTQQYDNEFGQMARALLSFRDNITQRQQAEQQLSIANEELNAQLDNIHRLHQVSEQQAARALNLAEGLSEAHQIAEQERRRVRSILDAVKDAIITIDTRGIIEHANPATEFIFGYHNVELIGNNVSMLIPEPERSQHDEHLQRFSHGEAQRPIRSPAEQLAQRKDGSTFHVEVILNTVTINNEQKVIGVVRDITERKLWMDEVQRLAMNDPLTGLSNRNCYGRKLAEAAAASKRLDKPFGLLLVDLDNFKPVNDNYGHPVGDVLLKHVAQTLINSCRESDSVARMGGDEFAVILTSARSELNCEVPAQRIIDALSKPVEIEGHIITIGASIGISCYPHDTTDLQALQRHADTALYEAKRNGRNTYRHYNSPNS